MDDELSVAIDDCINAVQQLKTPAAVCFIRQSALLLKECFTNGGKVIIAGNGGSLCDAAHFAEELTGCFRQKRKALPAIALTDPGHITCVGNDFGFEQIFARGVEAYGNAGDVFVGLTTSGNSSNLIAAFETAKCLRLNTIAFLGRGGGKLKGSADLELIINGFATSDRVQEAHMAAMHLIIELVEKHLFPDVRQYVCSSTAIGSSC